MRANLIRKIVLGGCLLLAMTGCSRRTASNHPAESPKDTKSAVTATPRATAHVRQYKGKAGQYARWRYDPATKCLTISGKGATHKDFADKYNYHYNFDYGEIGPEGYFGGGDEVREVIVERGITQISMGAFEDFEHLVKVTIPDTVTKISSGVFMNCRYLREIVLPDSVVSIGPLCFYGCESLNRLVIGKNLKSIGREAFHKCRSLRDISLSKQNPYFVTEAGILYQTEQKICCFAYANAQDVKIPKGIKKIGAFAFYANPYIQKVEIPASVSVIEGGAFSYCRNLKDVTFAPKSRCKRIKDTRGTLYYGGVWGAFENCRNLKIMIFPDSLESVGGNVLKKCYSLEKVYFSKAFRGMDSYKGYFASLIIYPGDSEHGASLREIDVSKENPYFCSEQGVMFDKKKEILYGYPPGKECSEYSVPKSVKKINRYAFGSTKNLKKLIIKRRDIKLYKDSFYESRHIILYGKENSTVQKYAKKYKMKFCVIK